MLESKPPGRLRTKLSFESEFEDVTAPLSNLSLNHDRKLLLQVMPFRFSYMTKQSGPFFSFGSTIWWLRNSLFELHCVRRGI
jgi:hypothetical protein